MRTIHPPRSTPPRRYAETQPLRRYCPPAPETMPSMDCNRILYPKRDYSERKQTN